MAGGSEGREGAADSTREEALRALQEGDRGRARRLLRKAGSAYRDAGEPRRAAECRMALGLTFLRVEGGSARASATAELAGAAADATAAGDEALAVRCLGHLRETVADRASLARFEAAVAGVVPGLSAQARARVDGMLAAARALVELAEGGTDPRLVAGLASPEVLDRLATDAGLAPGYAHVLAAGKAQAAGDLGTAEREADAGRQAALDTVDPFLYVLSCGAIARVRDERDDRLGALTILFTCKASLEDLLGPDAGAQVVPMIDALEARWGREAFARALAAYRSQFEPGR